jgi:hypothetical protein
MKFTQVPSQYSNQIIEVQARNKVWVCVMVPSCCLSCKSSTILQLFKQLTALLQPIDCRKAWHKQPQEQRKAPLTVQYEIHTSAQPIQQPICKTNNITQLPFA